MKKRRHNAECEIVTQLVVMFVCLEKMEESELEEDKYIDVVKAKCKPTKIVIQHEMGNR